MPVLLRFCYLGLIAWQLAWHALLPEPWGARAWWLALVAALPLLAPIRGVLRLQHQGLTWGAYVSIFYFLVGVMEAWSNPSQRPAALVQVALVLGYTLTFVLFSRRPQPR